MPEAIGQVDIALFGCVLLHVRDPFLALQQGTRFATDTVIVVEPFGRLFVARRVMTWLRTRTAKLSPRFEVAGRPAMRFIPPTRNPRLDDSSWMLSPEIVCAFLSVLGFPSTQVTFHTQRYNGQRIRMFTVVGRRKS